MTPLQVGDEYGTWFSGKSTGMSTVLKIEPYTGKYPQFFTHVVRLSAETQRGWLEMAVDLRKPLPQNQEKT